MTTRREDWIAKYDKPFDPQELSRRLAAFQLAQKPTPPPTPPPQSTLALAKPSQSNRPMTTYVPRNAARAFQQTASTAGHGQDRMKHQSMTYLSEAALETLRSAGHGARDESAIDRFIAEHRDPYTDRVEDKKNRSSMAHPGPDSSDTSNHMSNHEHVAPIVENPDEIEAFVQRRTKTAIDDRPDWAQRASGEYEDGTVNASIQRLKEKFKTSRSDTSSAKSSTRASPSNPSILYPSQSQRKTDASVTTTSSSIHHLDPRSASAAALCGTLPPHSRSSSNEDSDVVEYILNMPRRDPLTKYTLPIDAAMTDSTSRLKYQDDATYAALTSAEAPSDAFQPSTSMKKRNRNGIMFAGGAMPPMPPMPPVPSEEPEASVAAKRRSRVSAASAALNAAKQAGLTDADLEKQDRSSKFFKRRSMLDKRQSAMSAKRSSTLAAPAINRKHRTSVLYAIHSPAMDAIFDADEEAQNILAYDFASPRTAFDEGRPSEAWLASATSSEPARSGISSTLNHSHTPPTTTSVPDIITPGLDSTSPADSTSAIAAAAAAAAAPVFVSSMTGLHGNPVFPLDMQSTMGAPALAPASAPGPFRSSPLASPGSETSGFSWKLPPMASPHQPPRAMQVALAARALHDRELVRARAQQERELAQAQADRTERERGLHYTGVPVEAKKVKVKGIRAAFGRA